MLRAANLKGLNTIGWLVVFCATAGGLVSGAELVEELEVSGDIATFVFTGHTYPLMIRGLQFYLADKIKAEDPDFVVLGGDVVPGSDPSHLKHGIWNLSILEEQWARYSQFRSRLEKKVFFVPGNHDLYHGGLPPEHFATLARYGGLEVPYSARGFGPFIFIFLSTVDIQLVPGVVDRHEIQIDRLQLEWLKNLLQQCGSDSIPFLFMHHQLWNLDELPGSQRAKDSAQFRREVTPSLRRFRDVYIFAGDSSYPQVTERNVHYYVWANTYEKIGYYVASLNRQSREVRITLVKELVEPPVVRPIEFLRTVVREFRHVPWGTKLVVGSIGLALLFVIILTVRVSRKGL